IGALGFEIVEMSHGSACQRMLPGSAGTISLYGRRRPYGSRFDHIDDIAGRVEADGDQRAAEAAAGVDADGELADRDAAMLGIEPAHHPAEAVDWPIEPGK